MSDAMVGAGRCSSIEERLGEFRGRHVGCRLNAKISSLEGFADAA